MAAPSLRSISNASRGFTLVELLVVVAIIGLLIALLLPAIQAVRESARRATCASNLRQIGLGIVQYENVHKQYPPPYTEVPARHSLFPFIMPFIEMKHISRNYRMDKDWNSAENAPISQTDIPLFCCPSAPAVPRSNTATGRAVSDFGPCINITPGVVSDLVSGKHITKRKNGEYFGFYQIQSKTYPDCPERISTRHIKDGLSHTMMLFEDGGRPLEYIGRRRGDQVVSGSRWANYENYWVVHVICGDGSQMFNCHNNNEIYSFHSGGANFLYGDGAVRFHQQTLDAEVFVSLFTRASADAFPSGSPF